ncbi:MAG TPA: sulfurtransferase [Phycisphaerae bacterium]|mgnify:FL=1|nr:sulfurtransferase [Phycisphaerae bacterium]HOM52661.1 sulfurtransferase [Phycisphaerae bacterium]
MNVHCWAWTLAAGLAGSAWAAPAATQPADAQVRRDMLVSADWLAAHLHDPEIVVLHVGRKRTGYDTAHVPGARYLDWSDIAQEREGVLNEIPPVEELIATVQKLGIDETKRIVIYDEGEVIPAARAYFVLDYLGLGERAALLDGHWPQWKAQGRPVSTEEPRVQASRWRPQRLREELVVSLAEMREWVERKADRSHTGPPVIDARSENEYAGCTAGESVPRAGHIPGAHNVPSSGNLTSKEVPTFRGVPQLRKMYAQAGAEPGGKVIVYCRTGASASLDYFTAKYLGYQPRLFDGSFSQWSAQPDTPVVNTAATQTAP